MNSIKTMNLQHDSQNDISFEKEPPTFSNPHKFQGYIDTKLNELT